MLTMARGLLAPAVLSPPRAMLKRGQKAIYSTRVPFVAPKSRSRVSVVARGKMGGSDFTVPEKLVSLDDLEIVGSKTSSTPAAGAVRYTLRFYTGSKMGQGMSASDSGVQVMLIGEDGRAFMQRIDRYPDVGGMSDLALYSHPRFERGSIDEVTFDAPDLGLPAALWVAPEADGEWFLEEVELSCSEGSVMADAAITDGKPRVVSYPCMEKVGGIDAALELRPSVFVKMTAEQREEMRVEGLKEYGELKVRMLAATGAAVVLGCAVTATVGHHGYESTRAFASGGGVGLVYLYMLCCDVDGMASNTIMNGVDDDKSIAAHAADVLTSVVSSGPMRLLLLGLAGVIGSHHMEAAAAVDPVSGVAHPAYGEAFAAVLGFFSYKAGVLVAGFSGTDLGGGGGGAEGTPEGGEMVPIPINDNRPRRVEPWDHF